MGELNGFSGDDVIKRLRSFGYEIIRQRGSHVRLGAKGRRSVTVPRHREIGIGLMLQILREADVSTEQFIQA